MKLRGREIARRMTQSASEPSFRLGSLGWFGVYLAFALVIGVLVLTEGGFLKRIGIPLAIVLLVGGTTAGYGIILLVWNVGRAVGRMWFTLKHVEQLALDYKNVDQAYARLGTDLDGTKKELGKYMELYAQCREAQPLIGKILLGLAVFSQGQSGTEGHPLLFPVSGQEDRNVESSELEDH